MPLLRNEDERNTAEVFSADAQVLPSTANAKDGTIDFGFQFKLLKIIIRVNFGKCRLCQPCFSLCIN